MAGNHQHSRIDHFINFMFRFFFAQLDFFASSPLFWQLINYMLASVKFSECIVHLCTNVSEKKP